MVSALCGSLGLRASAQAVPPKSGTFRVVFDRADLLTRERKLIARAVRASTHHQIIRIEMRDLTGQGGTALALPLWEQRASNVRSELVRDGVAGSCISVHRPVDRNPCSRTGMDAEIHKAAAC